MYLSFTLSMPSNNSWNGKWSGEGNLYVIIKNFKNKKDEARALEILNKKYYSYNFGDGWRAGIDVEKIDGKEATKLRRKSRGFCGYDWMVDSICRNLDIKYKEE